MALEEELNWRLVRKYEIISREIPDQETYRIEDADLVIVAYGTAARIAKGAVNRARDLGVRAGLYRPKTLWPFPSEELSALSRRVSHIVVFEMSTGQMVEDVRLAVEGKCPVSFYGRPGGVVSTPEEVARVLTGIHHRMDAVTPSSGVVKIPAFGAA
jgi:2-oxoglutarate ferredoxin oxidoreductase subunit alpha